VRSCLEKNPLQKKKSVGGVGLEPVLQKKKKRKKKKDKNLSM
jgi:hypothetical protein